MKLEHLIVIFVIIILPISLILTSYVQNQVTTLQLQTSYDSKLTTATHDALKAFQLNTVNSSTSDLANSKMRDIEASVNTFFNSVATNFNMAGYNQDVLKYYVPALVYTMYDGFYIYSPFTNTLSPDDYIEGTSTYQNGEKVSGLKPYIFYSCRYIKGSDTDVVITYSLDNYITVQGTVKGQTVFRYGYLLDNVGNYNSSNNTITYRGITIGEETLTEYIGQNEQETYVKVNGVKYYLDSDGSWYSLLNGEKLPQGTTYNTINDSGVRYYREAKEFTQWVQDNLGDLRTSDAVFEDGEKSKQFQNEDRTSVTQTLTEREQWGDMLIFSRQDDTGNTGKSIEDPNSNFNQHRLQVIRYSIEKNLSIAIANYNKYDEGITTNFQMPELKEDEWEKILNNVSIISFLQGLSIGGKIYNGYSIVTNTKTEEVVNTDSIYIVTSDGQYHRATDLDLVGASNITGAYFNVDFERKSVTTDTGVTYYYPHKETGCYTSIVNQSNVEDLNSDKSTQNQYGNSIYAYIANKGGTLAQYYFTALGRERYSMYKTNNNPELLKVNFTV